jgi:hypothetical protein
MAVVCAGHTQARRDGSSVSGATILHHDCRSESLSGRALPVAVEPERHAVIEIRGRHRTIGDVLRVENHQVTRFAVFVVYVRKEKTTPPPLRR